MVDDEVTHGDAKEVVTVVAQVVLGYEELRLCSQPVLEPQNATATLKGVAAQIQDV